MQENIEYRGSKYKQRGQDTGYSKNKYYTNRDYPYNKHDYSKTRCKYSEKHTYEQSGKRQNDPYQLNQAENEFAKLEKKSKTNSTDSYTKKNGTEVQD